jgi:hypothetical protein
MLGLTDVNVLPERAVLEKQPVSKYKYRYTSGPFLLPQNSGSLGQIGTLPYLGQIGTLPYLIAGQKDGEVSLFFFVEG